MRLTGITTQGAEVTFGLEQIITVNPQLEIVLVNMKAPEPLSSLKPYNQPVAVMIKSVHPAMGEGWATCVYCNMVIPYDSDSMIKHIATCDKRPEATLLAQLKDLEGKVQHG